MSKSFAVDPAGASSSNEPEPELEPESESEEERYVSQHDPMPEVPAGAEEEPDAS